ncbi:hypothetical protein OPQ81_008964 [Rhizoctonia solani]|nr:hypothetical protein OPQ81_008964 [Rhizoctonia solani]
MSWVQPTIASSSAPPSHYSTDNLATDHFDSRCTWTAQATLAVDSLAQGVSAIGEVGAPRQPPYLSLPSVSESILNVQEASANPVDTIHGIHDHAISEFSCQINLATGSNSGDGMGHGTAQYEYSPDFPPSFDRDTYQQYSSTVVQIREANARVARDFGYEYTESHALAQPHDGVAQNSQRFEYDHFQSASEGSYLNGQPLNELYPGGRHISSFPAEYPYHSAGSFLERRASAMTLQETEAQPPFIISFDGTPLNEDTWSSGAFSSPSLTSFNSSPPSTQHDSSALGTPAQGFEDASVSHAEPLLNHPISYSISDLRHLSNSPAGGDSSSPQRPRRGAVVQHTIGIVPSQAGSSSRPFPEDTITHPVYAESFESNDDASDCSQPPTSERGFTPATSPSTSTGFDYPQAAGVSNGSSKPSMHGNTARDTGPKGDSSHVVPLIRQLSSKSADGRGQSGSSRHHPYGRSSKISTHEQVIQFDTPTSSVSTPGVSDHTEPESRMSKKKSKGSKRVYCEYICPVKREPCGQSVSREADMSRHMQRHRRAEETMIRDGILLPEQQTNFENLKADEITLCKRCGETLSRKDALRRHLKNAGKACRSFYPEIAIAD